MKLPPGTGRVNEGLKSKSNYKLKTTVREKEECEPAVPHRVNTARRTQSMDEDKMRNWVCRVEKTSSNLSFCIRRYIYISE